MGRVRLSDGPGPTNETVLLTLRRHAIAMFSVESSPRTMSDPMLPLLSLHSVTRRRAAFTPPVSLVRS